MKMWWAQRLGLQFVVSYDETIQQYAVSCKRYPNQGQRVDLGFYSNWVGAEAACKEHVDKYGREHTL